MRRLLKLTIMPSARHLSDLDFIMDDLSRDLTRSACVWVTSPWRGWCMTSVVGPDLNCATVCGVVRVSMSTHKHQPVSLSASANKSHMSGFTADFTAWHNMQPDLIHSRTPSTPHIHTHSQACMHPNDKAVVTVQMPVSTSHSMWKPCYFRSNALTEMRQISQQTIQSTTELGTVCHSLTVMSSLTQKHTRKHFCQQTHSASQQLQLISDNKQYKKA